MVSETFILIIQLKRRKHVHYVIFLLLNDFNPDDGTIKVVGSNKRVTFNKEYIRRKLNKDIPLDGLMSARITARDIETGEVKVRDISMGKDMLKSNSKMRQFSFGHESGHDVSDDNGTKHKWETSDNSNERAVKHMKDEMLNGKKIGNHLTRLDRNPTMNPEELEADLHSAKYSKIKTKHAGSKRNVKGSGSVRTLTKSEINRSLDSIKHKRHISDASTYINFNKSKINNEIEQIKKLKKEIQQNQYGINKTAYNIIKQNIINYVNEYDIMIGMVSHDVQNQKISDIKQQWNSDVISKLRLFMNDTSNNDIKIDDMICGCDCLLNIYKILLKIYDIMKDIQLKEIQTDDSFDVRKTFINKHINEFFNEYYIQLIGEIMENEDN